MLRTVKLATMVAMVLFAAAAARGADVCGDADGSGAITVSDGVQALRAAAGLASACTPARCDLDGSGTITVSDGVNVLRAAADLAVTLACPGAGPKPTCTTADVEVRVATPTPIGAAALELAYPAGAVALPGRGEAAAERVTITTATELFGDGSPNGYDDRVRFTLVALDGLGAGPLLRLRFDCLGPAPDVAAFACALADVRATDGLAAIAGATCAVTVAAE